VLHVIHDDTVGSLLDGTRLVYVVQGLLARRHIPARRARDSSFLRFSSSALRRASSAKRFCSSSYGSIFGASSSAFCAAFFAYYSHGSERIQCESVPCALLSSRQFAGPLVNYAVTNLQRLQFGKFLHRASQRQCYRHRRRRYSSIGIPILTLASSRTHRAPSSATPRSSISSVVCTYLRKLLSGQLVALVCRLYAGN
jgi:hypothetical protein